MASYGAAGLIFGVIKVTLSQGKKSFVAYAISASCSVPVAVVAGNLADNIGYHNASLATAAVAALLSQEIIQAVIRTGSNVLSDPELLNRILDAMKRKH